MDYKVSKNLKNYIAMGHAFVELMRPLVEVVIHDLAAQKICFIEGHLSKRKVGDSSLLDEEIESIGKIEQAIYTKLNFDGHLVKSVSIPIKEKGKVIALMCINADASVFEHMHQLASLFLNKPSAPQPRALFKNDWQERLHVALHQALQERKWVFEKLNTLQKKELVKHLFLAGAFGEKNAADYIAKVLDMGRATIFKYLKEWREK